MAGMSLSPILLLFSLLAASEALDSNDIEARGKKKKIGLLIYFADLVIKKIFLLKIVYAVVFWIVIHKAGYFLHWFVGYLKKHKHHHHEPPAPNYYDYGHHGPYRKEGHGVF